MGGEGGGMQSQTTQQLNTPLTTQQNMASHVHTAAHVMSRLELLNAHTSDMGVIGLKRPEEMRPH